jgi:Glucosyl transferase GtrII
MEKIGNFNLFMKFDSLLIDFYKRNKILILYSILISIITYGYELFNFTLSIDEEIQSFYAASGNTIWIEQGRWMTYFINLLVLPHSIIPYFTTLIAILCIAISAVLIINSFGGNLTSQLVFSTIFISIPSHTYYLAFNTFNASCGIGIVMVVLSYIYYKKAVQDSNINVYYLLISSLLLALSIGVYQSLITIFISAVLAFILNLIINEKEKNGKIFLITVAYAILILLFGSLFYKIGDYFFKIIYSTHNSKYIGDYWGWNKNSITDILDNIIKTISSFLNGSLFYSGYTMKSLYLVIPIILYHIFFRIDGLLRKVFAVVILEIFILSPFILMFVIGSPLGTRTIVALPLLLGSLWWFAIQKSGEILKRILIIVTVFIFIINVYSTTRLFYSSYVAWQADRDIANRIAERICSLDIDEKLTKIPVAFIGRYQHETNELFLSDDVFGASFFHWDNGNPYRMVFFMRTLGISNIVVADKEQNDKALKIYPNMPKWPKKGSVINFEDVVIVKLSDP